jgi:N-acetylglucosaminyl-diphospho-decaprenol L-rhamnosyltransferase
MRTERELENELINYIQAKRELFIIDRQKEIESFVNSVNPVLFKNKEFSHKELQEGLFDLNLFDQELFVINLLEKINIKDSIDAIRNQNQREVILFEIFKKLLCEDMFIRPSIWYSKTLYLKIIENNNKVTRENLSAYTLFDRKWYNDYYLLNDEYKDRPEEHFIKHGEINGLNPSAWMTSKEYTKIKKKYGNIGDFFDANFSEIYESELMPIAIKFFEVKIFLNGLNIHSLGVLINETHEDLKIAMKKIMPEYLFSSIGLFFRQLGIKEIPIPEWFVLEDFLEVNTDVPNTGISSVFATYIIEYIHQHRALSKKFEFAPKDLLEIEALVEFKEPKSQLSAPIINYEKIELQKKYPLVISVVYFKNSWQEINKFIEYLNLALKNFPDSNSIFASVQIYLHANSEVSDEIKSLINSKNKFPIQIIGEGINIGFGKAHNRIFEYSRKNINEKFFYFFILNPDGVLHPDALINASNFIKEKKYLGAFELSHMPIPHPKYYDPLSHKTNWFSGAAVIFDSDTFERTKGFDENIFLYSEDLEYSIRLSKYSVDIYTMPNSIFWHDTIGRQNHDRYALMLSTALYICKKYYDLNSYLRFYRELKRQQIPNEFKFVIEMNLTKSPTKVYKDPFFFRDFHFSFARRFNL